MGSAPASALWAEKGQRGNGWINSKNNKQTQNHCGGGVGGVERNYSEGMMLDKGEAAKPKQQV